MDGVRQRQLFQLFCFGWFQLTMCTVMKSRYVKYAICGGSFINYGTSAM